MENQFFTWDGWDLLDTFNPIFYKCRLCVDVGDFLSGTMFSSIDMDYSKGTITFWEDDGPMVDGFQNVKCMGKYKLLLSVGDKMRLPKTDSGETDEGDDAVMDHCVKLSKS